MTPHRWHPSRGTVCTAHPATRLLLSTQMCTASHLSPVASLQRHSHIFCARPEVDSCKTSPRSFSLTSRPCFSMRISIFTIADSLRADLQCGFLEVLPVSGWKAASRSIDVFTPSPSLSSACSFAHLERRPTNELPTTATSRASSSAVSPSLLLYTTATLSTLPLSSSFCPA